MEKIFDVALSFATEEQALAENVYHYLKAEGFKVFFAPKPECQMFLSGENQRESFYRIFGLESEYVVLLVSKHYVVKDVPIEEARIAFSKHGNSGKVIPIYIDGTPLPKDILDPKDTNYFRSNNPVEITNHIAGKIKIKNNKRKDSNTTSTQNNVMNISGNIADKQVFIQTVTGDIKL